MPDKPETTETKLTVGERARALFSGHVERIATLTTEKDKAISDRDAAQELATEATNEAERLRQEIVGANAVFADLESQLPEPDAADDAPADAKKPG